MVDRYRVWLGAGVLAGGMSAAMLAGSGAAAADDGGSAEAGSQAASNRSDEARGDGTSTDGPGAGDASSDDPGADGAGGEDLSADAGDDETSDSADSDSEADADADSDSDAEADADAGDPDAVEADPDVDPDFDHVEAGGVAEDSLGDDFEGDDFEGDDSAVDETDPDPVEAPLDGADEASPTAPGNEELDEPAPVAADEVVDRPSLFLTSFDSDLSSQEGSAVMRMSAAETPGIVSGLMNLLDALNDIGTAFYNVYTGAMQFLAGPARAPFGSRVRVESSSLQIGDGVEVSADWYFPPGHAEPKSLIYLQHGMLATSGFYGATAAYLAEKTHSIVVVPTLTWNIFDIANYPLMLSHTHRAIADLFTGDREALNASAALAGYHTTLPTTVVLAGHSAGGGLVVGTARYMVERGLESDLAGVVMFDGAGLGNSLSADLAAIPESIPVYNLAADPDMWNNFGDATRRLAEVRPDDFTGIVVAGGRHSDAMQSCSPLVQFAAYIATGFSSPWHVAVNQVLASGWISDMVDGTHSPRLYGSSGTAATITAAFLFGDRSTTERSRHSATADVCVDGRPTAGCAALPGPKPARLNAVAV